MYQVHTRRDSLVEIIGRFFRLESSSSLDGLKNEFYKQLRMYELGNGEARSSAENYLIKLGNIRGRKARKLYEQCDIDFRETMEKYS